MSWYSTSATYSPSEKTYSAREFRGRFPADTAHSGDVKRHRFDCQLAATAAAYARGPSYSSDTVAAIRSAVSSRDNVHYYGSSSANLGADSSAARKVCQSAFSGERVVLSPHEAAHIRSGAEWLAAHKHELPPGFVRSASAMYANVYDQDGHKVVDRRTLR